MNAGVYSLFSSLQLTSRKLRVSDSDSVDRLNHYTVPLVLCFISVLLCAKDYIVGSPLQCWVPKYYLDAWEQYAENLCWVENTFFVPNNASKTSLRQYTKLHVSGQIQYYQWVPFVLLLQALMFYLPHFCWRSVNWMSGIDIRHLMHVAMAASTTDPTERDKSLAQLVSLYQESFLLPYRNSFIVKKGMFLSAGYLLTKTAYVLNVILQFLLTSAFLGTDFVRLGPGLLSDWAAGRDWTDTGLFPRVTYCRFTVRTYDQDHPHTVQCVLPANLILERCYLVLWMLLTLLLFVTATSLFLWLWTLVLQPLLGTPAKLHHHRQVDGVDISIWKSMNSDSLLVLKLLKRNCLGLNFISFVREFSAKTELIYT